MGQGRGDLASGLDSFLEDLARRIAHYMSEQRRDLPRDGLIDQNDSPLGSRGHCAAVRRRLAADEPGADIVGRRHFLTREALQDELRRATRRKGRVQTTGELDPVADLDRALAGIRRRAS